MREQHSDVGRGITLCWEEFGDRSDPTALLIMGLATQMIGWHEDFCEELAGRGFHVVRFDNRDIGRSTHMDFRAPTPAQLVRRRFRREQYTLSDMAEDTVGLMRELELAPAHVIGASMGGMIAQTLAAEHPDQVRSLTSMMSSTGSRWSGQPGVGMYRFLLKRPPVTREEMVERAAEIFGVIGSKELHDAEAIRERAARSFDRGHDVFGGGRQLGAILKSGDRTAKLRAIRVPTLVLHGARDRLIKPSGGRATAKAIPGSRLVIIDRWGHDLPRPLWPRLLDEISAHARAADGDPAAASAA